MSTESVLQLVQLVQALVATARQLGVNFQDVAVREAAAKAEGREFDASDVRILVAEARAQLDQLAAAIDAAEQQGG